MSKVDQTYHQLIEEILWTGYRYPDPKRTGIERLEIGSYTFKHDFKDGFPAINTKKLQYKQVVTELIWFLNGDTNIKYLIDNGCNIWNKDCYKHFVKKVENDKLPGYIRKTLTIEEFINNIKNDLDFAKHWGDLGPIYGHQWRNFNGEDQIKRLIKNLKEQPMATDHIVNSWNAGELKDMALPPCHYGFQVVVRPLTNEERIKEFKNRFKTLNKETAKKFEDLNLKYGFELHWSQRSVDTFLGLPYNIASYATLALILEKITGYKALGIQGDLKKVHLYDNSIDAVNEQLSRDVNKHSNCNLSIKDIPEYNKLWLDRCSLDNLCVNLEIEDFKLEDYESDPGIRVEMLERDE